ncbi:thioredoxin family protein [Marinilongibacter aquaticus]|uniref:thioredoxin family protein n=1 Tax=Marinilongibacter aquaticus TaxID=2975157 RepID=UPI0021BDC69B|nr:thioredoxin family protein [Marinilongibacter aquaticus]UBM57742.1 thioredoxin family protein [Marinilongibacter aquaticus]
MKYSSILLFIIFSFSGKAQVDWQKSYGEAQSKAVEEGKKVLVECYHPECSHCQAFNANLELTEVYSKINEEFVGYRIDLSAAEDVKVLDSLGIHVQSYPVLLFYSSKGDFYNFLEPSAEDASLFLRQLHEVKNQDVRTVASSSINGLGRKAQYYMLLDDMPNNNAMADAMAQELGEANLNSQLSWFLFKRCVLSIDNTLFRYWIDHQKEAEAFEGTKGIENTFYSKFYNMRRALLKSKAVKMEAVDDLKSTLEKLGSDEKKRVLMSWDAELLYYFQQGLTDKAQDYCNYMLQLFPEPVSYLTIYQFINLHTDSRNYFDWFKAQEEKVQAGLKNANERKIYFEESAKFYGQSGDKSQCRNLLNKAKDNGLPENKVLEITQNFCL